MTLVELLVVIGIITMLMSLALPAINAARESGRKTTCMNNVRQLALAAIGHETAHGFFPSGGWAGGWVGLPTRGTGPQQPGGWVYAVLPFLERSDLAEMGGGATQQEQEAETARLLQTCLAVTYCPTRRRVRAYPIFYAYARQPHGSAEVFEVARCDYAINAGDQPRCEVAWFGPPSLAAGDDPKFPWPDVSDHTGVCYMRSRITTGHLRDGASRTYLIGEKYLSVSNYESGADHGDDWSMYTGYQDDIHRSTYDPPRRDGDLTRTIRFGSPHAAVWHVSFCDGSARPLSYEIDAAVHRSLGNRADGLAFDDGLMQ
jgi:hypothetical protein